MAYSEVNPTAEYDHLLIHIHKAVKDPDTLYMHKALKLPMLTNSKKQWG
jgi:hypothetical protein